MNLARRGAPNAHRIGEKATVDGELRFSGRLEIDGRVTGRIVAEPEEGSEVIVGPTGSVHGGIVASSVVIAGVVEGPVRAGARLEVLAGAKLRGDIVYHDLQIQHGALVEGALKPLAGEQIALRLVANSRQ